MTTSTLLEKADELLNDRKTYDQAQTVLEKVLKNEPNNAVAAYYLGWKLEQDEFYRGHQAARRERIASLCEIAARVTAKAKKLSEAESRARAFALRWPLPSRAVRASVAEAKTLVAQAAEASKLWDNENTQAASRAAAMGLTWATAREQKKPAVGYAALLKWVDENPLHSAWAGDFDSWQERNTAASCQGLEPFFADPGYVEWVRTQKPKKTRHDPETLARALAFAAGADLHEGAFGAIDPHDSGREGRIRSLLAIGASLDAVAFTDTDTPLGVVFAAARSLSLEFVQWVLSIGASINGDGTFVPLVAAAMYGEEAVKVLLAAGADPEVKGSVFRGKRKTALEVAREMNFGRIVTALSGQSLARRPIHFRYQRCSRR